MAGRLLATFALTLICRAQPFPAPNGAVEGTLLHEASGLPLGRVAVVIAQPTLDVLTDDEGRFVFPDAPVRTIQLKVSYLGFESQVVTVSVLQDGVVVRDFRLARVGAVRGAAAGGAIVLEKFEVVADQTMCAQALAINEQRRLVNIKNVAAFDELS